VLTRCCGLFLLLDGGGVGGVIDISGNGAGCTETDILSDGPCVASDIRELIADVQAFLAEPKSNGLVAKLNQALFHVENGRFHVAANKLGDFVDQVNAKVNSGELTAAEGQQLIDAANAIIDVLQSSSKGYGLAARANVEETTWSAVKRLYR
jgi:hypothetical protein